MYQLMIRKSKYEPLDIRKHPSFIIDSNFKADHLATLKEIDLLTTQFSDMRSFIMSLVTNKLMSVDNVDNQIAIRYADKGKMVTLSDSIIFSDGKAYLEPNTLLNTLRILSSDNDFINLLLSKYMPKDDGIYLTREYVNLETLQALETVLNNDINLYRLRSFLLPYRNVISNKNLVNIDSLYGNEKNGVINALIEIFFHNEVYKRHLVKGIYRPEYDDYADYYEFNKEGIQYRRLHCLAKFTSIYDLNRKKEEIEVEREYQEEFLDPDDYRRTIVSVNDDDQSKRLPAPKRKARRKRKNYMIPGQLGLGEDQ